MQQPLYLTIIVVVTGAVSALGVGGLVALMMQRRWAEADRKREELEKAKVSLIAASAGIAEAEVHSAATLMAELWRQFRAEQAMGLERAKLWDDKETSLRKEMVIMSADLVRCKEDHHRVAAFKQVLLEMSNSGNNGEKLAKIRAEIEKL